MVKCLVGHIVAFAFIAAAGGVQEIFGTRMEVCVATLLISWLFLTCLRIASSALRPATHHHLWPEFVCEGEDEAVDLALSFLTMQIVVFSVAGQVPPMHNADLHVDADVRLSYIWSIMKWTMGFILGLVCATCLRFRAPSFLPETIHFLPRERLMASLQNWFSYTVAWCLMKASEWAIGLFAPNPALGQVITAFVVTLCCVVLIVLLDCCADRLSNEDCRLTTHGRAHSSPSLLSAADLHVLAQEAISPSSQQRALRSIMTAFAFLTGISWERAFDAAQGALVAGSAELAEHPTFARIALAVLLSVLVLPAWMQHIAPQAMRSHKYHVRKIAEEEARRRHETGTEPWELLPIADTSDDSDGSTTQSSSSMHP